MSDPPNPQGDEVRLEMNDHEEATSASTEDDISQRLRTFTFSRLADVLTPFVEHVHNNSLHPIAWLNNNNSDENNTTTQSNNVRVTISNQSADNGLALSVNIQRDLTNNEDVQQELLANTNNNENETNQNASHRNLSDTVFSNNRKFIMFILILLLKFLYDHFEGVMTFACMQLIFVFLGDEQSNLRNKNILKFLVNFTIIMKCLDYIFSYQGLPITLVIYNPDFQTPTDIWDILRTVYMNDCALQLITMGLKLPLKCAPLKIISLKTKLKLCSLLEASSQLYRCLIPMQPWVYYFFTVSKGSVFPQPAYVAGFILAGIYSIVKCIDIVRILILVKLTIQKVLKRSGMVALNKEQLASKGLKCSICLDDFDFPLQLSCQHIFCSTCITQWSAKNRTCPLCRTPMTEEFATANITSAVYLQLF